MDAAVSDAITAVRFTDGAQPQRWFALVCLTYDQLAESGQVEWDQFTASLADGAETEGLGREIAEQFTEYLYTNDASPIETIGRMRDSADELPALYDQLAAAAPAAGEAVADGYDESTWNAFLVENGARWNGEEAAWEQFKLWFQDHAEQRGLATPANEFVGYVESQPDKVSTFAQYGIRVGIADSGTKDETSPVDVSAFPDVQEGDSGEWVEYLDTMLKSKGF